MTQQLDRIVTALLTVPFPIFDTRYNAGPAYGVKNRIASFERHCFLPEIFS
jgi:hypothetical protein